MELNYLQTKKIGMEVKNKFMDMFKHTQTELMHYLPLRYMTSSKIRVGNTTFKINMNENFTFIHSKSK